MRHLLISSACTGLSVVFLVGIANAATDSIGPNGIDSAGLLDFGGTVLTGDGIAIGQVEPGRPGKHTAPPGDMLTNANTTAVPTAVFVRNVAATADDVNIDEHAQQVAGVMISSDLTDADMDMVAPTGVALGADLYSSADNAIGPDYDQFSAFTAQHIATRNGGDVRAINMSMGNPLDASHTLFDGNQLLTQFVDWSASVHDVLYIVSGNQGNMIPIPKDNFNGMTIGRSSRIGGVFRQVSLGNTFDEDAEGDRTSISLIAPGDDIEVTGLGNVHSEVTGTSFAAPHVTGTVALLQEYADERISASAPRWSPRARHHEVMKAVLINSADKLIDDGSVEVGGVPVPVGGLLGMTRTVVKQDGTSTWLDSFAFDDDPFLGGFVPLDEEMGAGHLNARRALRQFETGEHDSAGTAVVPAIGWDYGHTTGAGTRIEYEIGVPLLTNSFVSITLVWDRVVEFDTDGGTIGAYDIGDTFLEYSEPDADDAFNDLDLYLLPRGATDTSEAIAQSIGTHGTVQHIFFQVPAAGEYEFWVNQFDADFAGGQDYAVAWWAVADLSATAQGDYDGDGEVTIADYATWKAAYGSIVTPGTGADGNSDGRVDGGDYVYWRNRLATGGSGAGGLASVPEPSVLLTLFVAVVIERPRRNRNPRLTVASSRQVRLHGIIR